MHPYHECSEYCFRIIAEAKAHSEEKKSVAEPEQANTSNVQSYIGASKTAEDQHYGNDSAEVHSDDDDIPLVEEKLEEEFTKLTGRKKKLFELRLKMKGMESPTESRGVTKQKWLEERKKKIGKLLDANGLDLSKAYMLDTQVAAENKYKKWEKDPAPYGWDVFNQKTLYNAYKKRTKNIDLDLDEYNKLKESDPEFYRDASSLQYGEAPKVSEDRIEKMVKELKNRDEKRRSFSRRRRYLDEKDIDSINDRNEHFNQKIERAFGKYTLEIKNNLEKGTALPD